MPISTMQYFAINITNESTFDDSQVYVLGFGFAPGATNWPWIQIDPSTGNGTLVEATSRRGECAVHGEAQYATDERHEYRIYPQRPAGQFRAYSSFNDATTITVSLPASNDVFGCVLTASPSGSTQAAEIVTVLATALNLGLLPLAPASPALSNQLWEPSNMPPYYTNSPQLPELLNSGPWIVMNGTSGDTITVALPGGTA